MYALERVNAVSNARFASFIARIRVEMYALERVNAVSNARFASFIARIRVEMYALERVNALSNARFASFIARIRVEMYALERVNAVSNARFASFIGSRGARWSAPRTRRRYRAPRRGSAPRSRFVERAAFEDGLMRCMDVDCMDKKLRRRRSRADGALRRARTTARRERESWARTARAR